MLEALGGHVASTDEMTGIQALERAAPMKPMRPGCPERREHEPIRHGTLSLIATCNVATGQILAPTLRPTRTEADFVAQGFASNHQAIVTVQVPLHWVSGRDCRMGKAKMSKRLGAFEAQRRAKSGEKGRFRPVPPIWRPRTSLPHAESST